MTKEEINQLGHAFFDGKTLECYENGKWRQWVYDYCPNFGLARDNWRIKPDEPKTITICTFIHVDGDVFLVTKATHLFDNLTRNKQWTHIKSLDQGIYIHKDELK